MKNKTRLIRFCFSLLIGSTLIGFVKSPTEKTVQDFSLLNTDGKQVSLSNYPDAKGFIVLFTCNHCPFAALYPQRLNDLSKKYAALGVPLIAINSIDTVAYEEEGYANMVEKATGEKFQFPYLYDANQDVAKAFKADKTPHAFIIWKVDNDCKEWVIKYDGAIDDNGAEPKKVLNPYVANAVDALLANKSIDVKETKSIGCKIYFRK
jgi:peroxiredoxin